MSNRPVLATLIAAFVVTAAAYLSVADNVPSLRAPFSFAAAISAMNIYEWGKHVLGKSQIAKVTWTCLAAVPLGLAFVAWSYPLFQGRDPIPRRSAIAFVLLSALSIVFFVAEWSAGITHSGLAHTLVMALYNLLGAGISFWCLRRNRQVPSYGSNLAYHAVLFSWLAYCSFPWMGEGP